MRAPSIRSRILTALTGIAALVALVAVPANAASAAPSSMGNLKVEQFHYVTEGLPASVARTTADPCKTYSFGVNIRTTTGSRLATFIQDVYWCYNGSAVTYHNYGYRPSTTIGWVYKGVLSESHVPGSGNWFWQDNAYAQFDYCPTALGCIGSRYASVSQIVYGNGTYSGSGYEA